LGLRSITLLTILFLTLSPRLVYADSTDPQALVAQAIEYWRDNSSYMTATMHVHRPDWERQMSLKAWTKGRDLSLVRFTAPAKDAGSASLTVRDDMWSYTPKVNRVIKIPPSMRGQSWMGSDFSYRDLSKSDEISDNYTHTLLQETEGDGKKVYIIESIPKEFAPVVWGKEVLRIREDFIILEHKFFDQDMKLVKQLQAREIQVMGGKVYPKRIRMEKVEEQDHWTEVIHDEVQFDVPVESRLFSLSYLRNPR